MPARRRVVVATCDPIGERMAGPAIRAWHFAVELSEHHDVELVTTSTADRSHHAFRVRAVGASELAELERWMDVLVFQGGLLRIHPFLVSSEKVIVADVYDPFHLENLEPTAAFSSIDDRTRNVDHLTKVLNEQLLRADFFLCASERQRDFWLGSLAAMGRISATGYDEDPTYRRLIDVVPFGLPDALPVRRRHALRGVVAGIAEDDRIVLWGGGVYNWFDPISVVDAIVAIRHEVPTVRLYFMGMKHPNADIPEMSIAARLREHARAVDPEGDHIFFNEGWVPYDDRADYLLDADVAVSTHLDHIETAFSFRTRILDYLWAGLPIVATTGDAFAGLIEDEGLGVSVAPGDVGALAEGLLSLLVDDPRRAACAASSSAVATRFRWSAVVQPLLAFCEEPRRAPPAPPMSDGDTPTPSRVRRSLRAASRRLRGR